MTSTPIPAIPELAALGQKVLVTGGGGFLGKAIVKMLRGIGLRVRSFSRGAYPDLDALGVEVFRGDLGSAEAVAKAAEGCGLVFHVAARPGAWGPYEEYYQANVTGTENVLAACRKHGIKRLVYTSSPSVVFNGKDMENVTESAPYPDHYEAHYPKTKSIAEKMVLAANSPELATCALRPHLIWGPEDNHLVPRLVKAAREGRLKIVGDNRNKVDTVYVDNAAEAHLLAATKLVYGGPPAGKAYFITNEEPRPCFDIVNLILKAAGIPPVTASISARTAYAVGAVMEFGYKLFRLSGEPPMTRWVATELATAHWFDITAAKTDFGYKPRITLDEGFSRLEAWFKSTGNYGPTAR